MLSNSKNTGFYAGVSAGPVAAKINLFYVLTQNKNAVITQIIIGSSVASSYTISKSQNNLVGQVLANQSFISENFTNLGLSGSAISASFLYYGVATSISTTLLIEFKLQAGQILILDNLNFLIPANIGNTTQDNLVVSSTSINIDTQLSMRIEEF